MAGVPTNAEVATTLRRLADLLEIGGEPVYRVGAYRKAAESIEALAEGVAGLRARGELGTIHGVGKGIAQKLEELIDTGRLVELEEIQTSIPLGVTELLGVPDIGPKRARQLYQHLGIASLADLRAAVETDRLAGVPGLGPKGAQRIAEGLRSMVDPDQRLPLPLARRLGQDVIDQLRQRAPGIEQIELAGSIRRFRDTIGDLDIVAAAEDPAAVVEAMAHLPTVTRIEMQGPNRCRVILQNGQAADLRVLPRQHWGSLLHHFTGSKYHDIRLRDVAIERGWSMSEYGYKRGDELVPCATEEAVFAFLDMDFIPAPMREETGEIEQALRHELPPVLAFDGLRGDLHLHSTWSDGTGSIAEMARAAIARGYDYLCVTDHSHGLAVANGLDADRLVAQRAEVEQVNAEVAPFRVLQGVEVEVRGDGSLDLPDEVLAQLDLVVASVHSGIRRSKEYLTSRSLAALRHPLVDILAHPTGRVLGSRAAGNFDVEAIIGEAAQTGTALEINGSRVDLNDLHARAAVAAGCVIAVASDAHTPDGLGEVFYAIGTAQRGWVPPDRVLNALPLDRMLGRLKRNTTNRS